MYLLFESTATTLRYGVFTPEAEIVYEGQCQVKDWSPRAVNQIFTSQVLAHLRSHGRIFSRVGFIVPYAPIECTEPKLASPMALKSMGRTSLERKVLEPIQSLLEVAKKQWPHLPHYFLFDTYLSRSIERHMAVPPFPYDVNKQLNLAPSILHSYGHKANALSLKTAKRSFVSLYVGEQVSMVLFRDGDVRDAHIAWSPLSPLMGLSSPGAFDPGFYLNSSEKKRSPNLQHLFVRQGGLFPMTETENDFEFLLSISGLVPRASNASAVDRLSIEMIEWIELAMRSFIRSLRHGVGALIAADEDVASVIISSPSIKSTSRFWSLVFTGRLTSLKPHFSGYSTLQAACTDLAKLDS